MKQKKRSTVTDGVEFDDLPDAAIADAEVLDVDINVGQEKIIFTLDELTIDGSGMFDLTSFNGYRLLDVSQSIAPITNVTIDFNSDVIEVNLAGVSYQAGDSLILNVEFASGF